MELPTARAEPHSSLLFRSNASPAVRFFWSYPLLVAISEVLAQLVGLRLALVIHVLLLIVLAFPRAVAQRQAEQDLTLALLLAPLPRLLLLVLPLDRFPQTAWYGLVALPMLVAAWLVAQQLEIVGQRERWKLRTWCLQLLLGFGGIAIGAAFFIVLPPDPSAEITTQPLVWAWPLLAAFCSSALNEIIFRGVLQRAAQPVLGRWAVVYIVLLLAALQVGVLPPAMIMIWALVGVALGAFARHYKTVLGVVVAHGLANATWMVAMPVLASTQVFQISGVAFWVIIASALSLCIALCVLIHEIKSAHLSSARAIVPRSPDRRQPSLRQFIKQWLQPASTAKPPRPIARTMRALRLQNGVKYTDLAQRTGLSVRILAEIEHGMRVPHPDQIDTIANGLGIPPNTIEQR